LAGALFGAAVFKGLPGFPGLAARGGFVLTDFVGFPRFAAAPALTGLVAATRFDGGVTAVFFVLRPDGWLRRFVGMGCSRVLRWPCH
jgi:hypothetical protein